MSKTRSLLAPILTIIVFAGALLHYSANNVSPVRAQEPVAAITPELRSALDSISEDSLRGHLSFIASDMLEGRFTPSPGLDIAAEYIAAQFRRAGLEAVGDDGYFQTANWRVWETPEKDFHLRLKAGEKVLAFDAAGISFTPEMAIKHEDAPLFKASLDDLELAKIKPEETRGRILIVDLQGKQPVEVGRKLAPFAPGLVLVVDRATSRGRGFGPPRLVDPANPRPAPAAPAVLMLTLHGGQAGEFIDGLPAGESGASLALNIPARVERPIKLRNVVGLLRGSDAELKSTYVLVTAHYDHVGKRPELEGDQIFNGANDDGSGTVAVIEIASALARLKTRPKRSILFMTVFGEERGLLGSRYYARNPIFPLKQTVANINLEHVGRTDSSEGSQKNRATLTGFDYSDLGPIFKAAGAALGIEVYKHEQNSDAFFGRSDNQALADAGVPSHTLCVAFIFPDYHRVGDHWDKIDYPNLAQTSRMVALSLVMMADSAHAPKWNEANPKAGRYLEAWKRLQSDVR